MSINDIHENEPIADGDEEYTKIRKAEKRARREAERTEKKQKKAEKRFRKATKKHRKTHKRAPRMVAVLVKKALATLGWLRSLISRAIRRARRQAARILRFARHQARKAKKAVAVARQRAQIAARRAAILAAQVAVVGLKVRGVPRAVVRAVGAVVKRVGGLPGVRRVVGAVSSAQRGAWAGLRSLSVRLAMVVAPAATWVRSALGAMAQRLGVGRGGLGLIRNPWLIGFAVAALVVGVAVVAWRSRRAEPASKHRMDASSVTAMPQSQPVPEVSSHVSEEELALLMAHLFIVVGADGQVRVHGIPASMDMDRRGQVAEIAADAATDYLDRVVRAGKRSEMLTCHR